MMTLKPKRYRLRDTVQISYRADRIIFIFIAIQRLLLGLIPTLQIIVTAYFIDTAIAIVTDNKPLPLIFIPLIAVVSFIAFQWVSNEITKFMELRLELSLREQFRTAILDKRARLAYEHIENHNTWDLISRVAKTPENNIKNGLNDILAFVSLIVRVGGLLLVLFTQVWWAALAVIAIAVPLFIIAARSGKATYEANREVSNYRRKFEYFGHMLTSRNFVQERSLFGYSPKVNKMWLQQYEQARRIEFRTQLKWYLKLKSGSILTSFISLFVVFILLSPVLTGDLSVGMFISLVTAVFGLTGLMSWQFTNLIDRLTKHKEYLNDLSEFANLAESVGAEAMPARPTPIFESLQFINVHFTYPGTNEPILKGLSFEIKAGNHYAIVGINGAGKTTITKLMTGLYTNFEGQILLNGKCITSYTPGELKAVFAMVYQDFSKYEISLKDNIAIGDVHQMDGISSSKVRRFAEQLELEQAAEQLEYGFDTPLGKIKAGGQDVSGGQWQRIAMARALMNPAPLRILDEPTSALDPVSESKLYEKFEQISQNKTTLFISHRLGSTKLADEIFVIGHGRMLEQGTHAQLMSHHGVYAEMFEKQRSWYA